ncbi:MAG TPA: lamin tail domain-containing protein, partial [Pontiella sp.]|nr:lamin tail domain-containing protein [Pontiella sp.]
MGQRSILNLILTVVLLGGGAFASDSSEPLGPSSRRGAMIISEIMLDTPSSWSGTNSLEFVEIFNSGLITEDLTGHRFSGEIDYVFPDGTTLAPGAFIVVAKDPVAAQSIYGVACLGPYSGKLSNTGGLLRFRNELDGILLEIEYDNKAP